MAIKNTYLSRTVLLVITALCLVLFYYTGVSELSTQVAATPGHRLLQQFRGSGVERSREGQRIAVLTYNTKESTYGILSLSNKATYCERHGYDFVVDFQGDSIYWHKFDMIGKAIESERYDWIWWIDFGTLITNTSVKLETIVEDALKLYPDKEEKDMILVPDCLPFNAGSMLFRAVPRVIDFLNECSTCGRSEPGRLEQDCMADVLGLNEDPDARPYYSVAWSMRSVVVRQRVMNSYPPHMNCFDGPDEGWQPGDFLIHFAGVSTWERLGISNPVSFMMEKYKPSIVDS